MGKRIEWVDIVKGFGILFVMFGHALLNKADAVWLYSFHLGLFFFCTGYTFHPERYETLGMLCKSRVKTVLLPYALYSVIWLIFETTVSSVHDRAFSALLFFQRVSGIFLQMRGTDYHGNCWFLPAIFLLDLLFYIVLSLTAKNAALRHLISVVSMLTGFCYIKYITVPLPWHPDIVLMVLILVDFGYTVRQKDIRLDYPFVVLSALVVSAGITIIEYRHQFRFDMYENSVGNVVFYLLGMGAGIILIVDLSKKIEKNRFLSYIGKNSLIFYALHKIFYRIEKPILSPRFEKMFGLGSENILHQYAVSCVLVATALVGLFFLNEIRMHMKRIAPNKCGSNCFFLEGEVMKELSLSEKQALALKIACDIDQVCRKHGIPYFIGYGSLIGAVRHQGFIPWDDDIDLWVPITQFHKFLDIMKNETDYLILDHLHDDKWPRCFTKISDRSTRVKVDSDEMQTGKHFGVSVDIFPLFPIDKGHTIVPKILQCKKMLTIQALNRLGVYNQKGISGLAKRIRSTILLVLGKNEKYFKNKLLKLESTVSHFDELGCVISVYKEKDIFPKTAFASSVDLPFEGKMFSAPAGYDTVLRQLYGDYMKLPPVEQRTSHDGEHAYWCKKMR